MVNVRLNDKAVDRTKQVKTQGIISLLCAVLYNCYIIFQINQPTRCNNFSSLLLDVYSLNMFRTSTRPSSGAQELQ